MALIYLRLLPAYHIPSMSYADVRPCPCQDPKAVADTMRVSDETCLIGMFLYHLDLGVVLAWAQPSGPA
jgi:hypothetical protein